MKKMLIALAVLSVTAISPSFYAHAQDKKTEERHKDEKNYGMRRAKMEKMFKKLDKNDDGKLSADELSVIVKARTNELDHNHDGVISKEEVDAFILKKSKRSRNAMLEKLGADKDGNVTVVQINKYFDEKFKAADVDHDGNISPSELRDYMREHRGIFQPGMMGRKSH